MSGSHTTTPGIPPRSGCLASISPNVLDTESLPGATRYGPTYGLFVSYSLAVIS